MKTFKNISIFLFFAALIISCTEESSTVIFRNRSVTNSTYTVVWDGSAICTLYPFTDSEEFDVKAGRHTLTFKISNTGEIGCSPSEPVLDAGHKNTFTCSQ